MQTYDYPVGIDELAGHLGKHTNTVREHINVLVKTGAITRFRKAPAGRGRPAWFYQAVAADRITDQTTGPARQRGVIAEADTHGTPPVPADDPHALFRVLQELGFDPEHDGTPERIRLRACPLKQNANPHVVHECTTHQRVIRAVIHTLGDNVDAYDFDEDHDLVVRTS